MESKAETGNSVDQLAPAVVAAFGEIDNVAKDATNPHFKSQYATLGAVLDTVRPVFARHGLAIMQVPGPLTPEGNASLTTLVFHRSGQHLVFNSQIPLGPNRTPQSAGSAYTYLRRYALAAITGIAQVDDDGEEASVPSKAAKAKKAGKSAADDEVEGVLQLIDAADSLDEISNLEVMVRELGNQKVADAFTTKRRELRAAAKAVKETA